MKVENDGPKNGINENGHKKVLSISIVFSINDVIDDVLADGKGLMSYSISHKQKQKGNFNKHQSVYKATHCMHFLCCTRFHLVIKGQVSQDFCWWNSTVKSTHTIKDCHRLEALCISI